MSRPLVLLCALATSLSGCRVHELEDGQYQFTMTQVLRDDCELASVPGVIGTGTLKTTGHVVAFDYDYLNVQLVGTYLQNAESMTLDGTAVNVTTQVRARECLLDTVALHLDATTTSPQRTEGSLSIAFDARSPDECVCKLWFKFTANRIGAAP